MLELKNISKTYKTGDLIQTALNEVSISFRDNEFVSILGPSGSGKTTMLNIIGGLDQYDTGDLIINGVSTKKYKDKQWDSYRNHSIGFIFQSYNLIPHQTILANVEMALTIANTSKKDRKKKAIEALEKVGLKEQRNKKPNQLSGGQMQRVAIARALVNNPDILLADEPTGALDSETGIQVMELLKEVAKDKLVIMVTHNPELAEQYSTRIIRIKDGNIVSDSQPVEKNEIPTTEIKEIKPKKVSMSKLTSFLLSLKNLMTKKGRTVLTSFAGSIGIIGIALILAVSDGVNLYIESIQKEAMTSYPITITATTVSSDFLSSMTPDHSSFNKDIAAKDGVNISYATTQAGNNLMNNALTENNLTNFKKYLDENANEINKYISDTGIVYSYGTKFSMYTSDKNKQLVNIDERIEGSSSILDGFSAMYSDDAIDAMASIFGENTIAGNSSEMLPDKETKLTSQVVKDNYELLYGHWPENYSDIVLALSSSNTLNAEQMCQLGLISNKEYTAAVQDIQDDQTPDEVNFSYKDICGKEFLLVPECSFYRKTADGYIRDDSIENINKNAIKLQISGIVKLKPKSDTMLISTPIGYTAALSDYVINVTEKSEIVKAQLENKDINVLTNKPFAIKNNEKIATAKSFVDLSDETKQSLLMQLMMSGIITIDMSAIDYSNYFTMPEIDTESILNNLTQDTMSKEEKVKAFDDYVNKLSDEDIEKLMSMVGIAKNNSSSFEMSDKDKLALVDEFLNNMTDEDLLAMIDSQDTNTGLFGKLASKKTKIKTARKYINNLSDDDKLAMFNEMSGSMDIDMSVSNDMIKNILLGMDDSQKAQMYSMLKYMNGEGFDFKFDMESIMSSIEIPSMPDMSDTDNMMTMYFDEWIKNASDEELIEAYDAYTTDNTYQSVIKTLGVVSKDSPEKISIYVNTFEDKENIQDLIDSYNLNVSSDEEIEYTDFIALLTSSLTSIINAISYVLIAFVGVSLFVSCIMISIITSISVMERTKEIGILRSLGASKRNVVSIFKAETCIIGCLSGLIGVGISYLSLIPINILADKLTHIDELRAVLQPQYALILVLISIIITIFSGWMPARKAAKCDPVIALRTE